ncbi:MAG: MBL fold metallo-hydrolase [Bacteroidetes bacterium]|nr:MAG: MBL fold metallo-hydrolase [Bacteroidota bacterium]
MLFRQIFDEKLAQYAYLIGCQKTGEAIVIDPERDIDQYIALAEKEGLEIVAVADTHIHADYLSGMREFAERGVKVYASDEGDADWKYEWLINSDTYDYQLLKDGDTFRVGNIELKAVHTPGHTPEHLSFLVTDLGGGADAPMGIVTGDFVFVGDLGRPDLLESAAGIQGVMEPSARTLYRSVQRFLELDDYLQVWPAHGAGSACGKALGAVPETTVGYERRFNAAIRAAKDGEQPFVDFILEGQPEPPMYFARMKRDNKLGPKVLGSLPRPRLLTLSELRRLAGNTDVAVLDTRLDRSAFMQGHLPGSLYTPFNKTFNTVAGSYVEENTPIYLIIDEEHVEQAVRDLVRIGLDNIVGYAPPALLATYAEQGGELASIEEVAIDALDALRKQDDVVILDVRGQAEYQAAHVPDAYNIAHTRLWVRRNEVPTGKKLAVHCKTGGRSAVAAALLARLGHDVIYVNGNFEDWAARHDVAQGGEIHAVA